MAENSEEILARFEELTVLEDEFDDAELQICKTTLAPTSTVTSCGYSSF
jgi:hypothetical protein